jgi:hypothetical protein
MPGGPLLTEQRWLGDTPSRRQGDPVRETASFPWVKDPCDSSSFSPSVDLNARGKVAETTGCCYRRRTRLDRELFTRAGVRGPAAAYSYSRWFPELARAGGRRLRRSGRSYPARPSWPDRPEVDR